jgi:hypothetical protein
MATNNYSKSLKILLGALQHSCVAHHTNISSGTAQTAVRLLLNTRTQAKMWTVAVLTAVAAVLLAYYLLKPKARGSRLLPIQAGCLIVAVLGGGGGGGGVMSGGQGVRVGSQHSGLDADAGPPSGLLQGHPPPPRRVRQPPRTYFPDQVPTTQLIAF